MEDPRFLVDSMLGTLAKWLRILGYDTEYDACLNDNKLVRLARGEGRILLTRTLRVRFQRFLILR